MVDDCEKFLLGVLFTADRPMLLEGWRKLQGLMVYWQNILRQVVNLAEEHS